MLDQIEFRDLRLDEALRLFCSQTGLKVIASPEAGRRRVTLSMENVNASAVLDAIVRAYGLMQRCDPVSGIVTLYTPQEYRQDLTNFREELTKVFTLMYPNAFDVGAAIRDLFGPSRVRLTYGLDTDTNMYQDLQYRFTRFDLVDQRSNSSGIFGGASAGPAGLAESAGSAAGSAALAALAEWAALAEPAGWGPASAGWGPAWVPRAPAWAPASAERAAGSVAVESAPAGRPGPEAPPAAPDRPPSRTRTSRSTSPSFAGRTRSSFAPAIPARWRKSAS
ncbi:MAG: hypothetical protein U0736_28245 [Gemmataceae bacterium]